MTLCLCLDQGGHASRALVLDERGGVIARAVREVATQHPAADRVEQQAEEIAGSLIEAARQAIAALGARAADLTVAGLATQRSSIACWDRLSGAALSPVISWQDRRAHEWLARFSSHASEIARRTGLRLSPHYGASKLRRCQPSAWASPDAVTFQPRHAPALMERYRRWRSAMEQALA